MTAFLLNITQKTYGMRFEPFPLIKPTTKLKIARTMNTINRTLPSSIETPAIPYAPNNIATSPRTKKVIAARNI